MERRKPCQWHKGCIRPEASMQVRHPVDGDNVLAHRVWLECPSDKELVEPKWKWKSIREPTASEPGGSTQDIKQEAKEEEPEKQETPAPHSKRSKRTPRQFQMRETHRVWVDTLEEAAVVK